MNLIVDDELHGSTWDSFRRSSSVEKTDGPAHRFEVAMVVHVNVISDVIRPWCFIGKRRLEKAIASLGRQVEVRWPPSS
jgi:hypothetical protein